MILKECRQRDKVRELKLSISDCLAGEERKRGEEDDIGGVTE